MRVIRAIVLLDQIEDELVGDLAHCIAPHFDVPHRTTQGIIWAKPGNDPVLHKISSHCTKTRRASPAGLVVNGTADHGSDRSRAQPSLVDSAKQMNL
jgi:hypothetical protein